jgi:hypothetical protein
VETRTLWLRRSVQLVGLLLVLAAVRYGFSQQFNPPALVPSVEPPIAQPVERGLANPPSVDQLIDQLTKLRRQKLELDQKEQMVIRQLRERLRDQRERLERLGVTEEPPPVEAPVPAPAGPPPVPFPQPVNSPPQLPPVLPGGN